MTGKVTYRILACWRCRGVNLPERGSGYWCPACGMPLAAEDIVAAWNRAGSGEALPLTADTWDAFLRCHALGGNAAVLLQKRDPRVRAVSWSSVSLRELREHVDQGSPILWLPKAGPGGPEGEALR